MSASAKVSVPYDAIRMTAADLGCKASDILAMSTRRDPFYCGQPSQVRDAQWFTHLYQSLAIGENAHLRRIHYKLVSQLEPPPKPNGEPYQNTDKDWKWFCESAVAARTLGLVDVRAFVDRRNPDPLILRQEHEQIPRAPELDAPDFWFMGIHADLDTPSLAMPRPRVRGYSYSDSDQPYLIEVWVEKTTMNDVLIPICRRYRANLVTAAGFQSITAAVNLIERARRFNKPARIFYISDFDPAGDKMPIAVARQVEYWIRRFNLSLDIALTPIALTAEQVAQYRLPRIPIKETDNRRAKFEAKYGEGAVELDALEAIYPGELGRLLNEAIAPYWDTELENRLRDQAAEVRDQISFAWSDLVEEEARQVARIQRAITEVFAEFQDELSDLSERLNDALEPYREDLEEIERAINTKRREFDPDLPERLASDLEPPDESAWLFSSLRGYLEQIAHYHQDQEAA